MDFSHVKSRRQNRELGLRRRIIGWLDQMNGWTPVHAKDQIPAFQIASTGTCQL